MVKALFEFQSRYYVHFQKNTVGKGMKFRNLPIYGLNSTTIVFLKGWIRHRYVIKLQTNLQRNTWKTIDSQSTM